MSQLTIFAANDSSKAIWQSQDSAEIIAKLADHGVVFEQWQTDDAVAAGANSDTILSRYAEDIKRVQANGRYLTVDVISLAKGNANAADLRQKFLSEHTHTEDEVRFFVKGQGLFCLHLGNQVLQLLCVQGDLVNVPANTKHWFDMGSDPEFTAIRFFNNEAGWVAQSTGSTIASQFPLLD